MNTNTLTSKTSRTYESSICKCRNTYKVYLVRHGQSEWNDTNKFTGWYDAKLTQQGKNEAIAAGLLFKQAKVKFDIAFSSVLKRCIETADLILAKIRQRDVPIITTWRLNERHYGGLTGLNKVEIAEKFGAEQVKKWRRGYADCPPAMDETNPYYYKIINDPIYLSGPPKSEFPMYESLKLTILRVLPFWQQNVVPEIRKGRTVLISGHGNSLRGIVKVLDDMNDEEITNLDLPNGIPFYYELDRNMKPIRNGSLQYLDHPENVKKALNFLIAQSKKKA